MAINISHRLSRAAMGIPHDTSLRAEEDASGSAQTNAPLTKHLVWAHSMIDWPLYLSARRNKPYGELYPLDQESGPANGAPADWQYLDISHAKAAGIDGFAIDVFDKPEASEPYLRSADKLGFLIAMCLDLSVTPPARKEDEAYRIVSQYCDLAARHSSAARLDGAFVIETYGTEQLPIDAWERILAKLKANGYSTYWIVSVDTDRKLFKSNGFPAQAISDYFGPFDAGYLFGSAGPYWNQIVDLFSSLNRPFMGGIKPGYYRYKGALEIDPEGTALYRREWRRDIHSGIPWNTVITWNDLGENTAVIPSGDWNFTRSDLTRWYSALYKSQPFPFRAPRLYITTPKVVYPGQKFLAETLVLNPLNRPLTARIQLFDAAGHPFVKPAASTVPSGATGAAVANVSMPGNSAGQYVRARADVFDGSQKLATVTSAPVLVLDAQAQPGYGGVYYSIPADHSLAENVKLRLFPADRAHPGVRIEPVVPPGVTPRFIEILHNTSLVSNVVNGQPREQAIPARNGAGQIIGRTPWGFYVARITDTHLRVAYSDPVYIAPPRGDYSLRERYKFGSNATSATDASVFKNVATIKGAQQVAATAQHPAYLSFDGKSSRVDLLPSLTPDGPISIKITVRPHAFGGCIFADTGGLSITLSKDGRVVYTRFTGKKWETATGKTPLALNAWSEITCDWDGRQSLISINGKPDGRAACEPGFTSYLRSVGCNPAPYGFGSDFFSGDISSFEIRLLKAP